MALFDGADASPSKRTVGALLIVELVHDIRWIVAALGGKQMTIQFPDEVLEAMAKAAAPPKKRKVA